jgi:Ca-activated chloride channel homolog
LLLCGGLISIGTARGDESLVVFHGKVALEDGSPPGHLVGVQRTCTGAQQSIPEGAASGKTGEYIVRLYVNEFGQIGGSLGRLDVYGMLPCVLEASGKGFVSSRIDLTDRRILRNPRLPDIVLTPANKGTLLAVDNGNVPRAAARNWAAAIKQLTARNWAAAETPLRAVVEAAPNFAPGWAALGTLYSTTGKEDESVKALARATEIDPKPLPPYLALARAQLDLKDWPGAAATTERLIARDLRHVYVEAYFLSALAHYQSHDYDGALAHMNDALRLDKLRELPRAEYVLGLILDAKGDYTGAAQHLRNYVEQHPRANNVAQVKERIANLGNAPPADLSAELTPLDLRLAATGEAPVPGGIKAFSAIAELPGPSSADQFFLRYCRTISEGGPRMVNPTKEARGQVRAFISTVAALESMGERGENSTRIRLSMESEDQIRRTREILAELGLKVVSQGDRYTLAPGDRPGDGLRQSALAALGIDELALRQAVETKREFVFEIPRENARLVGGPAWGLVLKDVPDMRGPVEAFTKDWRFTRVYSGLGAMDNDSAAAVVAAIGLPNLIVKYSELMADYGEAISLDGKSVAVPGGVKAQAIWTKLAGADPQKAGAFLRALFEKDQGELLAFYCDLMHADAAHQQFFTQSSERAEAFYKWYRDSVARTPQRWQTKFLQNLRLDASGKVIFPGGLSAWGSGNENDELILLHGASLEALAAIGELEEKRGSPLSADAAKILAEHFFGWRSLFGYFEKLPGLDAAEFRALADFADAAAKAPADRQNMLLGEWHSLVELTVLGSEAGSLTHAQAAQSFRLACEAIGSANPSAGAIETLRAMAGSAPDLDEAVASRLLRFNGGRREAFESVKKLQNVPRLSSLDAVPDAGRTVAALGGAVYAALLDPAYQLVVEDPQLLNKHEYMTGATLFAPSSLHISSDSPGTNFEGGFASFREEAGALRQRMVGDLLKGADETGALAPLQALPLESPLPSPASDLVFRAGGRIVEVYATVTDSRGRYVDDLEASQFSILETGQSKPVFAFENHTASVSVALLSATTQSMVEALPPLRAAALRLVDDLRPADSVAVYSFADTVSELHPFTSDKQAAKRAILQTRARGITALYDALVRVNRDLSDRPGKKVIVVFTDGADNCSMLTANTAIERAKARGIPIYTVAEGEALEESRLMAQLTNISQATGGSRFTIHKLSDIGAVIEKVSEDLLHGYLVAFQPAPGEGHNWRKVELVIKGRKGLQVRARQGYYVE